MPGQMQSRGLLMPSSGLVKYNDKTLTPEEVMLTKVFERREIARRKKEAEALAERRILQESTAAIIGGYSTTRSNPTTQGMTPKEKQSQEQESESPEYAPPGALGAIAVPTNTMRGTVDLAVPATTTTTTTTTTTATGLQDKQEPSQAGSSSPVLPPPLVLAQSVQPEDSKDSERKEKKRKVQEVQFEEEEAGSTSPVLPPPSSDPSEYGSIPGPAGPSSEYGSVPGPVGPSSSWLQEDTCSSNSTKKRGIAKNANKAEEDEDHGETIVDMDVLNSDALYSSGFISTNDYTPSAKDESLKTLRLPDFGMSAEGADLPFSDDRRSNTLVLQLSVREYELCCMFRAMAMDMDIPVLYCCHIPCLVEH